MPPVEQPVQITRPVSNRKIIGGTISARALAAVLQPELKSVGELACEMRKDPIVSLAEQVLGAKVKSAGTTIKVTGGDARGKLIEGVLQKLWDNHITEMLHFLGDGRAAFEEVWAYSQSANLTYIRKLDYLPFKYTKMLLDRDGSFDGIELKAGGNTYRIERDNSWWLALDPTALEPHGQSRFMGAPEEVWKERREAIRLRKLFVLKMVLSGGVMHAPDQATLENGETIDTFAAIAAAHDARMSGGLMILPNSLGKDGSTYEYDYTDLPSVTSPQPLDAHIEGLDQLQLLAFAIPPKALMEGDGGGSYAMLSLQMEVLNAVVDHITSQAERSFEKYIAQKVLAENFAPGEVSVKVSHESLLSNMNPVLVEIIKAMLVSDTLPALVEAGVVDIAQVLRLLQVPMNADAVAKIEKLLREKADQVNAMAAVNPLVPGAVPAPQAGGAVPPNKPPVATPAA